MASTEQTAAGFLYSSWGNDPTSVVVVNWQSDSASSAPTLRYRPAGATAWEEITPVAVAGPGKGQLYRAIIDQLAPATTYEYTLGTSAPDTFSTAPAGAADYRCLFFCDTGLIGRLDKLTTGTAAVRDAIRRADPLFLLGGGDYAYGNKDGCYKVMAEAADEWFRQWQSVLPRYPFFPQYGNHEILLDERFEDWGPRFVVPHAQAEGRYYSFDVGDVHYSSLFVPDYKILPDAAQLAWLEDNLATARANGARWLVVYLHSAIYGCGISHPSKPELTNLLVPYFDRHKVDLVLSGHDQSYERTFPLEHHSGAPVITQESLDSYLQGNGVIYAKISPSGKQSEISKDFSKFTQEQQHFMARRDDTAHHYAIVQVAAQGTLTVEVYSILPHATEPTLFDRFTIRAAH